MRISLFLALKTELPWSKCPPWGPGMAMLGLSRSEHHILDCLKSASWSTLLKRLPHPASSLPSLVSFFPKRRFLLSLVQVGVSHYVLLPGLRSGAGPREGLQWRSLCSAWLGRGDKHGSGSLALPQPVITPLSCLGLSLLTRRALGKSSPS